MEDWREGEWVWKWRWNRELLGHDHTVLQELIELLKKKKLKQRKQDQWRWRHNSMGSYATKSAYNELSNDTRQLDLVQYSRIWNKDVPLKVSAFAWKALQNRIPTRDNLQKEVLWELNLISLVFCADTTRNLLTTYSSRVQQGGRFGNHAVRGGVSNLLHQMKDGAIFNNIWVWF
ncbi:hypothetical protein SLEP1_g39899 [Rubroshorea leprosula]|uniref:Reverse transcriptase zinc-binding domain-containing protein n=1 Tax=Rubroshorea leprosula TaxID=152421 RepID=A0AAV5L1S2_9ROSI|nr:hypothetical protein SLEP1_g39899 [Rubroshorea leprosula]